MASLDSYIKDRNERMQKGTLVYSGVSSQGKTTTRNFSRLNNQTYYSNNNRFSNYYNNH